MLTTAILLQPQVSGILHSSNLLESLEPQKVFESQTLRLNLPGQDKLIYKWSLPLKIKKRIQGQKSRFHLISGNIPLWKD